MQNLRDLIIAFGGLVKMAVPIVAGLAFLGFFWGLTKYIYSQGNEQTKVEGKNIMIYGLIALFVMVSVWGIIGIFQSDLDLKDATGIIQIQTVGR